MAQKGIPRKIKKTVNTFIDTLKKEKLPLSAVYLFGSFAKGNPHEWSDIDICVVSPKFKNSFEAISYLNAHRPRNKNPYEPHIEAVGFSPKDFREEDTFIYEIKKHGVKII